MSRGERMKFQMAFAMGHKPCIYLLDEVTAGMDPVFRMDFFKIFHKVIEDESASVLMTSHIESEMEHKMDYLGILENGKLVKFGESLDVL
jgi:ABC-2 type transport system ATP-binding protein